MTHAHTIGLTFLLAQKAEHDAQAVALASKIKEAQAAEKEAEKAAKI